MQGRSIRGEVVDHEQMVRLSNTLSRLIKGVYALKRPKKARSTRESLAELLAEHRSDG